MKKVFRFHYKSDSDYVRQSSYVFFYIPLITRMDIVTPLQKTMFEVKIQVQKAIEQYIRSLANTYVLKLISYDGEYFSEGTYEINFYMEMNEPFLKSMGILKTIPTKTVVLKVEK